MFIHGIELSPLRNIMKQFSVRSVVNYSTFNEIDDKIICPIDRAEHERKCRLEAEYQFFRGGYFPDPKNITADEWIYLYNLPSFSQRRKHLKHLYGRQARSCIENVEKAIRNEIIDTKKQLTIEKQKENNHIIYGLGHNFYLNRISRQQMNKWMNLRMHRAKQFGQKLIIDCGFDDRMTEDERRETAWKLEKVFIENRTHNLPFDLYYFGGPSNNISLDMLIKRVPTLIKSTSMTEIRYDKCYTESFPKDRLVMLTPDSSNVLEYNFDDIYVIGGIVDKGSHEPMTLSKARRLDIRTARLPLHYLSRERSLNPEISLDVVAACLRERQIKTNWANILDEFVPTPEVKAEKTERKRYRIRQGSDILKYKP